VGAILALLGRVAAQIAEILGLVNGINTLLKDLFPSGSTVAQETAPFTIQTYVEGTNTYLGSVTNGLPKILADISALQDSVNLLGSPQQGTSAVILPTTPPAGYGALNVADTQAAVWNYILASSGNRAGDALSNASDLANAMELVGARLPAASSPWLEAWPNWTANYPYQNFDNAIYIDPSTILPTDATILDFLQRVDSADGWALNAGGMPVCQPFLGSADPTFWYYTMPQAEFEAWKSGARTKAQAPIWPGLAGVTLGTPVALVDGLTVAGPIAGVIVEITAARAGLNFALYGTHQSYRYIAQVAFATDDGEVEGFQMISWDKGVYLPKSMAAGGSAIFHVAGGTVGTVTPFTIP
jgi:hypothetical protein